MMTGRFNTYIITLLLVFAFCGTRVAVVLDFSDYHEVKTVNIDQADPHGIDMDDVKNKQLVPPTILLESYDVALPGTVASILPPTDIQSFCSLSYLSRSFPSRASPA